MGTLKEFHGDFYSEGPWDSKKYACCRLCKTKNIKIARLTHWASGLCRSCYRRLSAQHRKYNDTWTKENVNSGFRITKKKEYKSQDPENIMFDDLDIETVLERYAYKCTYCKTDLQIYDQKQLNFLQIEYMRKDNNLYELVPTCTSCTRSKKNLTDPGDLRQWAISRGIDYPFIYIKPS